MTKYTEEQYFKAHFLVGAVLSAGDAEKIIDYLRSPEAKADSEAGFWDEPLDPIEQARREAREIAAQHWEKFGNGIAAMKYRKGHCDNTPRVEGAFAALCQERGLEVPE